MKNTLLSRIILVAVLSMIFLTACKKDSPSAKGATSSIKDKTWWGALTFTGKEAEFYSVHFNADNTLLWSQASGDYTGKWSINGRELSMVFDVTRQITWPGATCLSRLSLLGSPY